MTVPYTGTLTPEEEALQNLMSTQSAGSTGSDQTTDTTSTGTQAVTAAPGSVEALPGTVPEPTTNPSQIPSGTTPGTMPPPVPPTYNSLESQVADFASKWMSQGNPYLSPAVTAARQAGEANLSESARKAQNQIGEWAAQRGLVGSSYEGEQQVDLAESMQRARGDQEAQLLQMMADAETLNKQAAGQYGLNVLTNQQNVSLRAQELMQNDRSLDLQEARDLAAKQLAEQEMAQQGEQFEATLAQRETEFARSLNMTQQQFEESSRQFQQQFGEEMAARLQQNEQFYAALQSDESRYAMDIGLRSRALDLQEAGLDMEDAYRQAALIQERELTTRAQDLQELGLNNEDAVRWATLEQDRTFHDDQVRLEERGYNLQESYQEAEQDYKLRTLDIAQQEVDQRAQEIRQGDRSLDLQEARDQAQVDLAREEMQNRLDLANTEINQRESEFARSHDLNEREFTATQNQLSAQLSEQTAARIQQNAQFYDALQSDEEQAALQRALQGRSLDLQQQGLDQDAAFQQAQQDFEYGYTNDAGQFVPGYQDRVLQLQNEGMNREDAYRWAALESDEQYRNESLRLEELGITGLDAYRQAEINIREQQLAQEWQMFSGQIEFNREQMLNDNTYRNRALDLEERGLEADDAYRQAELEYRERVLSEQRDEFMQEMQFRIENATTAEDQFNQMYDLWKTYFGKDGTGENPYQPTINVYTGGSGDSGSTGGMPNGVEYPTRPTQDGSAWHWDGDIGNWVSDSGEEYQD